MAPLLRGHFVGFAGDLMNLGKINKPASLSEWLEIATGGLAASGKERITHEIEAHYAAAIESHLAHGESEPVAQTSALEELGDAKKARRSFRKRHLTEREEKRILKLQNWSNSRFWLVVSILGSLCFVFVGTKVYPEYTPLLPILIVLGGMAAPAFMFWIVRQQEPKTKLSVVLLIYSVQMVLCAFTFALLGSSGFAPVVSEVTVLYSIATVIQSIQTWKKIRKNENPTDEMSGLV
jgi:hypothetical protein